MSETKKCKVCGEEKPLESFWKNRLGYSDVCRECVKKKRDNTRAGKSRVTELEERLGMVTEQKLSDFTPRELMVELKRRGYKFTMEIKHVISSDSL